MSDEIDDFDPFDDRPAAGKKPGFQKKPDTPSMFSGLGAEDNLATKAEFGAAYGSEIDVIRDLGWIYNNLAVKDVEPKDAPSSGAYAFLKFFQETNENLAKFMGMYARLIPAKSQIEDSRKKNDDNRATFTLLDRLQKESGRGQT